MTTARVTGITDSGKGRKNCYLCLMGHTPLATWVELADTSHKSTHLYHFAGRGENWLARGGGRGSPPKEGGGGVWQWGSCDRTLGKVPITLKRGC